MELFDLAFCYIILKAASLGWGGETCETDKLEGLRYHMMVFLCQLKETYCLAWMVSFNSVLKVL